VIPQTTALKFALGITTEYNRSGVKPETSR
jgi:hypothetical protein